ncbi:hypothetical protein M513_12514 [Trichuris suis]|uniref:non-specific serine/threonine protein kinase n=1 Tax=Trichuris suis TaxID=68888 RepID=A0A085LNR9_9BILA|nr:hypothetical protein M513_12514 [Trichuris suis]
MICHFFHFSRVHHRRKDLLYLLGQCYLSFSGLHTVTHTDRLVCNPLIYALSVHLIPLCLGDKVHFTNLSSISGMFSGVGDEHFDVYRSMRDVIRNSWRNFNPKTNVLWLVYLADYLG